MNQHEPSSNRPCYISGDLVVEEINTHSINHPNRVTSLDLSPDGALLAIGDISGKVTLRDMNKDGKKIAFLKSGKDVRITAMTWGPRCDPWTLFVASANGYINCISFSMKELTTDFNPRITGVKVSGLVTYLAVNKDGSQLAAAYAYFTKVWDLPFPDGEPHGHSGRLINTGFPKPHWRFTPVREHPRVVGLQYLDEDILVVAFFSKIEAYATSDRYRTAWTIQVPDNTNIGAFCISPDGKLIAATNLHSGIDWYSLTLRSWMSTTEIPDIYEQKSYLLPVQFLTERTFASGHNVGQITTGCNGFAATKALGKRRGSPSQYLTVARLSEEMRIVYACASSVLVNRFKLSGAQKMSVSSSASPFNSPEVARTRTSPTPQFSAENFGLQSFQASPHASSTSGLRVITSPSSPSIFQTPAEHPFDARKPLIQSTSKFDLPKSLATPFETPLNHSRMPSTRAPTFEPTAASAVTQLNDDSEKASSNATVKQDPESHRDLDSKGSDARGKHVTFVQVRTVEGHVDEIESQFGVDAPPFNPQLRSPTSSSPSQPQTPSLPSSPSDLTSMTASVPNSPSPPQRVDPLRPTMLVKDRVPELGNRGTEKRSRSTDRRGRRGLEDDLEEEERSIGSIIYSLLGDTIRTNPKVFVAFLAALVAALIVLLQSKGHKTTDSLQYSLGLDPQLSRPESYLGGASDGDHDFDDFDDFEGETEDQRDGRDTLVITQTDVLTVTRTVTSTTTSTVTVTQKPRRTAGTQKPRRRQ